MTFAVDGKVIAFPLLALVTRLASLAIAFYRGFGIIPRTLSNAPVLRDGSLFELKCLYASDSSFWGLEAPCTIVFYVGGRFGVLTSSIL